MEQRTCNIIMCCKGHCQLGSAGKTPMEAIAAYMSKECDYPKEKYKGRLLESILLTALFDFFPPSVCYMRTKPVRAYL